MKLQLRKDNRQCFGEQGRAALRGQEVTPVFGGSSDLKDTEQTQMTFFQTAILL